jgi:hypothetical protein
MRTRVHRRGKSMGAVLQTGTDLNVEKNIVVMVYRPERLRAGPGHL